MIKRSLTIVSILMLASMTLAQDPLIGGRLVLSPDSKRAALILRPLVLTDNDGQYLDVIISGRYLNKQPQPKPDGFDLTFFSRSAEPQFRRSHRLVILADGEPFDLGRTSYSEFGAAQVEGKTVAVAKLAPEEKIEPFAPADSRLLLARGDRKLTGELMVRDGLTFDQWYRINSAAKLQIRLGSVTVDLDQAQRQLLNDFTAKLTPSDYRLRPEKVNADLFRRQTNAPSAANQASLEATLKWLKREAGSADNGSTETYGSFIRSVDFASCKMSYRVESTGGTVRSASGPISGLANALYVPPLTVVTLNLADLDPDLVSITSNDRSESVQFETLAGESKIHLEFRGGLQFDVPGHERARDKWKNSESVDIRDRRLAPQFAEAFAHAITLCQQQR